MSIQVPIKVRTFVLDDSKLLYFEKDTPGIGISTGISDAGSFPFLGPDGKLDPSFIPNENVIITPVLTFSVNTGTTIIPVSTRRPIISIQPKLGTFGATFLLRKIRTVSNGALALFEVILNGALTNANFIPADPASKVNFDIAATNISGGTVIDSGFLQFGQQEPEYTLLFGFTGSPPTPDTISLVVTSLGNRPQPVSGSFRWIESV